MILRNFFVQKIVDTSKDADSVSEKLFAFQKTSGIQLSAISIEYVTKTYKVKLYSNFV